MEKYEKSYINGKLIISMTYRDVSLTIGA